MSRGASLGSIAVLLGLCALPAQGQNAVIAPEILYALTSIDTPPTTLDLQMILGNPTNGVSVLLGYALESSFDFGLRLRATRAIPQFCTEPQACRAAIIDVFDDITDSTGRELLRKRAAIEALAAARTGDARDIPLLVGFLSDDIRDIRVAAARALRDLCNPAAMAPLRQQRAVERVVQVRIAIDEAIAQCGP